MKTLAFKLGICPDDLSAKLDMLLYMEKGSSIDWCANVEEDESVIATMLIRMGFLCLMGRKEGVKKMRKIS